MLTEVYRNFKNYFYASFHLDERKNIYKPTSYLFNQSLEICLDYLQKTSVLSTLHKVYILCHHIFD